MRIDVQHRPECEHVSGNICDKSTRLEIRIVERGCDVIASNLNLRARNLLTAECHRPIPDFNVVDACPTLRGGIDDPAHQTPVGRRGLLIDGADIGERPAGIRPRQPGRNARAADRLRLYGRREHRLERQQ